MESGRPSRWPSSTKWAMRPAAIQAARAEATGYRADQAVATVHRTKCGSSDYTMRIGWWESEREGEKEKERKGESEWRHRVGHRDYLPSWHSINESKRKEKQDCYSRSIVRSFFQTRCTNSSPTFCSEDGRKTDKSLRRILEDGKIIFKHEYRGRSTFSGFSGGRGEKNKGRK